MHVILFRTEDLIHLAEIPNSEFLKILKKCNITIFEERKVTFLLSPCFYVKEIFTRYMSDIDYKVDVLQVCVHFSAI